MAARHRRRASAPAGIDGLGVAERLPLAQLRRKELEINRRRCGSGSLGRIEELPRLLRVTVGEQLHRTLEVGEEDGDLLALAFQCGF